jgi:hypothetical protein
MGTRRAPYWGRPSGCELSYPAAQGTVDPSSRIRNGKSPTNIPHASRVSCSEVSGGQGLALREERQDVCVDEVRGRVLSVVVSVWHDLGLKVGGSTV